jgi:hypothetical protein
MNFFHKTHFEVSSIQARASSCTTCAGGTGPQILGGLRFLLSLLQILLWDMRMKIRKGLSETYLGRSHAITCLYSAHASERAPSSPSSNRSMSQKNKIQSIDVFLKNEKSNR